MPCCCVPNCSQRSENGVRLFRLPQGPKNELRRTQWLININRDPLPLRASVCEHHFAEDQFEHRRADGRKLLKWNAIPTIFPARTEKKSDEVIIIKSEPDDSVEPEDCHSEDYLKKKLELTEKNLQDTTKQLRRLKQSLSFFGPDQIQYLLNGSLGKKSWETTTIKRSMQLYLTCGLKGYEMLRSQRYPLPPIDILQHKMEELDFEPNVVQTIFETDL